LNVGEGAPRISLDRPSLFCINKKPLAKLNLGGDFMGGKTFDQFQARQKSKAQKDAKVETAPAKSPTDDKHKT